MRVEGRELETELLVVGAGPAGSAAAITAASLGLRVVMVDKAAVGRDKTCGDGLTTAALRRLEELGVRVDTLAGYAPVHEVVLVAPSGREIRLTLPETGEHAGVIARAELDAALVARARDAGAMLCESAAVVGLARSPDETIVAELADGTRVRADWIVAADGHYSTVRRTLGPGTTPALGEWSAFRQYFLGVDDPRLWVLFEADLLPGYAWVFPLPGGGANVGFGVLRRPGVDGKAVKATWRSLLERPGMRSVLGPHARPAASHRAWPIPTAYDVARLTDRRVLYVGDAASVVDPMTGEGIAQALETGTLAARAVASGGDVTTRYRRAVERDLGRDLRFAATLQRVLQHRQGAELALATAGLTPWTRRNFARWMFEDYPRAIALTPRRWKRGMFTAPGAYS